MKPRIFSSSEWRFDGLGLGSLTDAISCTVTEDLCGRDWRGGEYALEMEYPITGHNYDLLVEERIICAKPSENATEWQPFRIYAISRPIGGVVTVKADHISRQLKKVTMQEFSMFGELSDTMTYITNTCVPNAHFVFQKIGNDYISTYGCKTPKNVFDLLCGQESILDQYSSTYPECYTWDKWNVKLGTRGSDRGVTITYGINMTGIEKASDMTNTITGYMPYWEDDQKVVRRLSSLGFYDDVVLSDNYTDYAYKMIEPLDVGSIYNDHKEDPAATLAQLIQDYAYEQLAKVSILPATIDVEFVSLNATDQYKSLMESRMIRLGDTVKVRYDALGIDEKQRVIKTVFNVLANRYESIEIGTKQIDLAGVIAKIAKRSK